MRICRVRAGYRSACALQVRGLYKWIVGVFQHLSATGCAAVVKRSFTLPPIIHVCERRQSRGELAQFRRG